MNFSSHKIKHVTISAETLTVELKNGRVVSPSKPAAFLTLRAHINTSMAKRSKSRLKRPPGSAQGTAMVLTPSRAQSTRGTRARRIVSNCIVSRCRHMRSGA
jgi:hypothetical protein